jgi:hypothetical protein
VQGPVGPLGPQGPAGPAGPAGRPGNDGLDGKDADTTAITNALYQWLEEHKHEFKGDVGPQGESGESGKFDQQTLQNITQTVTQNVMQQQSVDLKAILDRLDKIEAESKKPITLEVYREGKYLGKSESGPKRILKLDLQPKE